MLKGVLIAESLQVDARLEDVPLTITGLYRVAINDATKDQPPVWTIIYFEAREQDTGLLTEFFAAQLDTPGWYADMHTDATMFVIFPHKVFAYPRGDKDGRAEAIAYAHTVGVPETQFWSEDDTTPDPALS
ncbi:hypothetical protein ACQP2U_42730 (plasmid) [Nocardia sp. CA-084685]|uniref:hypothetical protein n=1 Tax=Nocardia sp. CA-084685 TaxID=3239970 RepID=UPI003D965CB4